MPDSDSTADTAPLLSETQSPDRYINRARPTFLYLMYAMLGLALPMGLLAAISPATAAAMNAGIRAYLASLPDPLYTLFGTGYLGYTAARQWGKVKGSDR